MNIILAWPQTIHTHIYTVKPNTWEHPCSIYIPLSTNQPRANLLVIQTHISKIILSKKKKKKKPIVQIAKIWGKSTGNDDQNCIHTLHGNGRHGSKSSGPRPPARHSSQGRKSSKVICFFKGMFPSGHLIQGKHPQSLQSNISSTGTTLCDPLYRARRVIALPRRLLAQIS